jgi:hypothetical protein
LVERPDQTAAQPSDTDPFPTPGLGPTMGQVALEATEPFHAANAAASARTGRPDYLVAWMAVNLERG